MLNNKKHIEQVLTFMKMFQQEIPDKPCIPVSDIINLRIRLLLEELNEYSDATSRVDKLDALCDIAYVLYGAIVAYGLYKDYEAMDAPVIQDDRLVSSMIFASNSLMYLNNIQSSRVIFQIIGGMLVNLIKLDDFYHVFDSAFSEVQRSNMSKLWSSHDLNDNLDKRAETIRVDNDMYIVKLDGKVIKSPTYSQPNLEQYI